jgi:hypothetical protein
MWQRISAFLGNNHFRLKNILNLNQIKANPVNNWGFLKFTKL